MSEIVRGCHQGVMGHKLAEDRLRGSNKEFVYLTRESNIKKGKFIMSSMTGSGSSVKHTVAPNPSARKSFQSLEEASEVSEKTRIVSMPFLLLTLTLMLTTIVWMSFLK